MDFTLISEWLGISNFLAYGPKIMVVVLILVTSYVAIKIVSRGMNVFFSKVDFEVSAGKFLQKSVRVFLWIIVFLLLLNNLGVEIGPLIAGLGIAGFVIGFALQSTISNFASGIFIMVYKPFKLDDWIKVGEIVGEVEEIGMAATTLKSPDNKKIVIPNSKIWGTTIENFSANPVRKLFNLDVSISYEDSIDKAIKVINGILSKHDKVLKEPEPQVVVKELGENGVKIAVRPSVKNEDYWDVFFYLNRKIKEEFDRNKITIPYPQRTVRIKKK